MVSTSSSSSSKNSCAIASHMPCPSHRLRSTTIFIVITSDLDGVDRNEVNLLADTAVRAAPVVRDVRPGSTCCEALVLVADRHLVGVATARAAGSEHLSGQLGGSRSRLGGDDVSLALGFLLGEPVPGEDLVA